MRFPMRLHEARRAPRRRCDALLVAGVLALSVGACDDEAQPPVIRTLDGPTDIAFMCQGRMRVTQGQDPAEDQPIVTSPMPLDACRGWNQVGVNLDGGDPKEPADDQYYVVTLPPTGQGPLVCRDMDGKLKQCSDEDTALPLELGDELLIKDEDQKVVQDVHNELVEAWQAEVKLFGFALQQNTGTVALVSQKLGDTPTVSLLDADPYAPGRNVIPVGSQPVGIVADHTGCHMMTANAGSCDLSSLDVAPVLSGTGVPVVHTLPVRNAAGELIAVKPRAIVAQAAAAPLGFECTDSPDSLVYIAYPDCNAVAAVHAGTGEVRASIVFAEDGSVVLGDGNLSCGATTCGAVTTPPVATRPRPVALHMASDGARLYIGAENSPQIAIVDLGPDALPTAAQSVALEGDVGVTALAATELIPMGGALGRTDVGPFGIFRFVYAAATDNTVRVAEVRNVRRECDTQIDPRFLHDVRDGQLLACLPVGDPSLPRRVGARSPGIHMPGEARPLDIAFVRAPGIEERAEGTLRPPISSANLIGHFAYISLSTGVVVLANVDDDNYGDIEDTAVPVEVDMSLALPHQLRDLGASRRSSRYCEEEGKEDEDDEEEDDEEEEEEEEDPRYRVLLCEFETASSCDYAGGAPSGPPSLTAPSVTTLSPGYVAESYLGSLPALRTLECVDEDGSAAVHELSAMVPDSLRELVFPDLQSVRTETWNIVWEGLLSRQNAGALDPGVRLGYLELDGGLSLRDGGAPFCEMGAEPGDVVTLRGCNPALGNQHCQGSDVCAVLPDIEVQSQLGICLPAGSENLVQQSCLPFFASQRRFQVEQTYAGRLVLGERKRILRTTPEAGCSSAAQCAGLYDLEQDLALGRDLQAQSPQTADGWACEPDPVTDPARNVCMMTCASDLDCETGWQCSGAGYCVEAALPPAQCVTPLQRYDVRAGNAFAVVGGATGFLHDRVVDPATGECVADPAANPLAQGRVPLSVPPCTGEGFLDIAPNPCAATVSHSYSVLEPLLDSDGKPVLDEDGNPVLVEKLETRQTSAIRFRNPAFVTHLVDPFFDPAAQGIACTLDGAACPPMPAVPPGYAITFTVASGFVPLNAVTDLKYPVGMASDPLGSIWIMDQGDVSAFIRGQIARFSPLSLQVTAVIQ